MALIDCPECGRRVSSEAVACPQCGFPILDSCRDGLRRSGFTPLGGAQASPGKPREEESEAAQIPGISASDAAKLDVIKRRAADAAEERKFEQKLVEKYALTPESLPNSQTSRRRASRSRKRSVFVGKASKDLGPFLLLVPVVGTSLVLGWVGNMRLIDGPASALGLVGVVVFVSFAVLAAIELLSVRPANKRESLNWTLVLLLFGIFAFPFYMGSRARMGLKGLFLPSFILTIVFVLSAGMTSLEVYKRSEEVERSVLRAKEQLERLEYERDRWLDSIGR